LTISIVYYLATLIIDTLLNIAGSATRPRFTILYYHDVPADYVFEFRRQMTALTEAAHVLRADFEGKLPTGRPSVAITFDDAFRSVATNAIGPIRERTFHCTIFVPVEAMGKTPRWSSESVSLQEEVVMNRSELEALSAEIVTIGSHSSTHRHLSRLAPDALEREVGRSRIDLEKIIGRPVRLFAAPYGDIGGSVLDTCQEAGYDFVYSTIPELIDSESHKFLRGRTRVDPWDGPMEFFLKYNGAYAWLTRVSFWLSRIRARKKRQPATKTIRSSARPRIG
jgi:peptidoglycan/xylan/chitin deacetylase (PgdA/CDA1 family)